MENLEKEFEMLNLHSESFESKILSEGDVYIRRVEPINNVRKVGETEVIKTFMPDGTLESTQEANPGDWVITGPEGEEFVFTDEKLNDLYTQEPDGSFLPKERKILAIKNPVNSKIRINAPWGTEENPVYQDGETESMVVIGLDSDGSN
jgi:hypothetical protein